MRILVLDGHPDADRARFIHALADAYAEGATGAGHQVATLASSLSGRHLPARRLARRS